MVLANGALRQRIIETLCDALAPLPYVLAGWEGGSAAFGLVDEFSDIDVVFVLGESAPVEPFYALVTSALERASPIIASHPEPPGRYFKLMDAGDFLLVDVCVYRPDNFKEQLDAERHGKIRPLFDKGQWLQSEPTTEPSQATKRAKHFGELKAWFGVSQSFVQKAILRGQEVEALAAFWGYTLRPLVVLLRMKYCPLRWDFGMRYLHRDLPGPVYDELQGLLFIGSFDELAEHAEKASSWGLLLLDELEEKG